MAHGRRVVVYCQEEGGGPVFVETWQAVERVRIPVKQEARWGAVAKAWFWLNDWAGCWLANHLVADHPNIKIHLSSRLQEDNINYDPLWCGCGYFCAG